MITSLQAILNKMPKSNDNPHSDGREMNPSGIGWMVLFSWTNDLDYRYINCSIVH